jgi:hypothetical protein
MSELMANLAGDHRQLDPAVLDLAGRYLEEVVGPLF